jgi:hypothetical protein
LAFNAATLLISDWSLLQIKGQMARIACQVALFADASSSAKDGTSWRQGKKESRIHDAVMVTPAVYQRSFN